MTPKMTLNKLRDTGHAKILESFERLIANGARLDQTRLDPPSELKPLAMQLIHTHGTRLQTSVENAKAAYRIVALECRAEMENFIVLASASAARLTARGASAETMARARGLFRRIEGKSRGPNGRLDPASTNYSPTEKNIAASHRRGALKISAYLELVELLENQSGLAGAVHAAPKISDLRAAGVCAQTKHAASIERAAALTNHRHMRSRFFYLDPGNLCELAARYKRLVKNAFGAKSPEYKTINAIPFKKTGL